MRVTYRYIRPCVVLYARGIGAYATSVTAAWRTMHGWLEAQNVRHLFRRGLGIFNDDPSVTSVDALRYEMGQEATSRNAGSREMPQRRCAGSQNSSSTKR